MPDAILNTVISSEINYRLRNWCEFINCSYDGQVFSCRACVTSSHECVNINSSILGNVMIVTLQNVTLSAAINRTQKCTTYISFMLIAITQWSCHIDNFVRTVCKKTTYHSPLSPFWLVRFQRDAAYRDNVRYHVDGGSVCRGGVTIITTRSVCVLSSSLSCSYRPMRNLSLS